MLRALFSQVLARARPAPAQEPPVESQTGLPRALQLYRDGRVDEAFTLVREILAENPEEVDAVLLEARILRKRGDLDGAMSAYRRALVIDPRRTEAWLDLGVCYHLAGDDFWARVYMRFANALDRDNADVWNETGLVEITLGNYEKAEESLEHAVNRRPEHPEAWNNLGLILARRGNLKNARRHFLRATFLRPEFYMAQCNLGLVDRDLELLDEAETVLRRAIEIDPAAVTARLNLAIVLQDLGRMDEALELLEALRRDEPDNADVLAALSAQCLRMGEAARAIDAATQGLAVDPNHADSRLALAHAQLAQGDFSQGWRNYEGRRQASGYGLESYPVRDWTDEDPGGRRLLVQGEQGLGDEIMFASCLPDLEAVGAEVLLVCNTRLRALMRRSFPSVEVVEDPAELQREIESGVRNVDLRVPLGSLPLRFRSTRDRFPARAAYLVADRDRAAYWTQRLAALGDGIKVGVSWSGGLYRTGRVTRSLPPQALLPALRVDGVNWVNLLHHGQREPLDEFERVHGIRIANWDEALADLDETVALISSLDLVVTVCSTVAHLAGALGKRALVMTPHAPAWRYLLRGESMPWYPQLRLIRQATPGNWDGVVDEVTRTLQTAVREAGSRQ